MIFYSRILLALVALALIFLVAGFINAYTGAPSDTLIGLFSTSGIFGFIWVVALWNQPSSKITLVRP